MEQNTGVATINEHGEKSVRDFVREYGTPACEDHISAWFREAEDQADNTEVGFDIILEIGKHFSLDKNPHTLTLDREDFDWTVVAECCEDNPA